MVIVILTLMQIGVNMPKRDKQFIQQLSAINVYNYIPMYEKCSITINVEKGDTAETIADKITAEYDRVINKQLYYDMINLINRKD